MSEIMMKLYGALFSILGGVIWLTVVGLQAEQIAIVFGRIWLLVDIWVGSIVILFGEIYFLSLLNRNSGERAEEER